MVKSEIPADCSFTELILRGLMSGRSLQGKPRSCAAPVHCTKCQSLVNQIVAAGRPPEIALNFGAQFLIA
jgi:hypothetical protein